MRRVFFLLGIIFLFSFVSSVTLNSGIVLNTTVSNSSVNFSYGVNVTNFTVTSVYVSLIGINFTNSTGSYNCSDLNYSTINSMIDVSEFNCSLIEPLVPAVAPVSSGGANALFEIDSVKMKEGETRKFLVREKFLINVKNEQHTVEINSIQEQKVLIRISSEVQEKWMGVGEEWLVDLNNDSINDLYVKVNFLGGNYVELTIKEVEVISPPKKPVSENKSLEDESKNKTEAGEEIGGEKEKEAFDYIKIVGLIFILFIIFRVWFWKKSSKRRISWKMRRHYRKVRKRNRK